MDKASPPVPPGARRWVEVNVVEGAGLVREATCIRCGCTDSKACEGGCSWLWVDRKIGRGLCSQCEIDAV